MGHTEASYADQVFLRHVLGGILYAAGFDAPSITTMTVSSRARRISVSLRHSRCRACRARLTVAGRTTVLRESERSASGRSARVAAGRYRVRVVLTEPVSGLAATAIRVVRVPS
jgi:hypothetical protein